MMDLCRRIWLVYAHYSFILLEIHYKLKTVNPRKGYLDATAYLYIVDETLLPKSEEDTFLFHHHNTKRHP